MPNPCPDCAKHSACGCKAHAPKHMEAGRIEARLEAIQDVLGPLALPNESEADVAKRIAADAALWREVRPFLTSLASGGPVDDRKLWEFLVRNELKLKATQDAL